MDDSLARLKTHASGNRLNVPDNATAERVIDGLASGALRAAADVSVKGQGGILGTEGQELLARSILRLFPDRKTLARILSEAKTEACPS